MKKLFCLSVLLIGFFVSINAQTLFYQVENLSANEWSYGMEDGNGNFIYYQQISATSSVNDNFTNFALPINFRAYDQGNGCYVYGTITGVGSGAPAYFCTSSSSLTWNLTAFGGNYFLTVTLDD